MTTAPISLRYDATPELVRAAIQATAEAPKFRSQKGLWTRYGFEVIVVAALASGALVTSQFGRLPLMLYAAFLVGILAGMFLVVAVTMRQQSLANDAIISRLSSTYGTIDLRIDDEGLEQTNSVGTQRIPWSSVTRVGRTKTGTTIVMRDIAIVVPDAALPDGMTPKAFHSELAQRMDST